MRANIMLLAVDVGNTNVVAGVFSGERLLASWRFATTGDRSPDEYGVLLTSIFELDGLDREAVTGVVISSVVPPVEDAITRAICRYWRVRPLIVSPQMDTDMAVRYDPRHALGPDRFANAVAALHVYGAPAIVVDFGTATKFEAISPDGAYVGGAIAPGIGIAADALFSRAARLRPVPLVAPPSPIGHDTTTSLQSGILLGYAGLVDGIVERFRQILGAETPVIATGGLAQKVAPQTNTVQHVDPELTLVGLRLLYQRHARSS